MHILGKLVAAYRRQGYNVRTGLNPYHFNNYKDAPFTVLLKDGIPLSTGGGISLQEIYFLEYLFEAFHPDHLFIIGNAFGWSTIALALMNPQAKVVALDAGTEGEHNDVGTRLTLEIARQEGLNVAIVQGRSPGDVPSAVSQHLDGRIDFVFVDGLHTNAQQEIDYRAVRPFCSPQCVYVFHDVVDFKMEKSFHRIVADSKLDGAILHRTPSGMGVLYPPTAPVELRECIDLFREEEAVVRSLRLWRTFQVNRVVWPVYDAYRKLTRPFRKPHP